MMASPKQLGKLTLGVAEWNIWRKNNPTVPINLNYAQLGRRDLAGIDLRRAQLKGVDFSHAVLTGANLSLTDLTDANLDNADLTGTDFTGAILKGAHLREAHLIGTYLRSADCSEADFTATDLRVADFRNAKLTNTNLTGAFVSQTVFGTVDRAPIVGLAHVSHFGPSVLGIDALYKSSGNIPDAFLRGCGVPDEMISFIHAMSGAIQYYSSFISYNHKDEVFATRLYNDLQMNAVRCWKYTEDMKAGDDIFAHVDQAIRFHDKLLVIFSEFSVQSEWVRDEVESALDREKREGKQILFPITIDRAIHQTDQAWAARIRRKRNIVDFVGWQEQEQYQAKFARLLDSLKQSMIVS